MATPEHEPAPPLSPAIRGRLCALRAKIRRYVLLEGFAALAVCLGAAFWGSMAIDWSFELPKPVRVAVLAVVGLALACVIFRFILGRAFVRLSDGNMATILERQFPELNDSLLTSVSLLDRPVAPSGFNPQMLARTNDVAQQRLSGVALSAVFNPMPLVRKVVIALGLGSAVVLLAVSAPDTLRLWTERNLLLANTMWPHKIRLEAVGFTDGVAKVAAGSNFDLRVRAFRGDTEVPVIPDKVEIRYRMEGGARERKTMKTIGRPATSAAAADEALQEYSYPFTGVLNSVHIDVAGGDGRISDLQLLVVPNPNLNLTVVCKYPTYMERNAKTIESASGTVRVPTGSVITIHGTSTKPLEVLRIDGPLAEGGVVGPKQYRGEDLGAKRDKFTLAFAPFPAPKATPPAGAGDKAAASATAAKPAQECMLEFTLRDTDGLKARDPILLTLVAVPDEPPEVKVQLVGTREPVVTPKGRLPVKGTITDDHGLERAWFDYAVEERAAANPKAAAGSLEKPSSPPKAAARRAGEVPLAELPNHLPEFVVKEADVKASQMSLVTGQRLTLAVRAADLCSFINGPNIGNGETWQLDVVSEDELVTRLEAQELLIKQRFEAIVEEMTETRNLLLKMDFTPPEKAKSTGPKPKPAGAEPGDRAEEAPKYTADELNKRRLERTLQTKQNCDKNAVETAEIAAAIEEIRLQLDNNQANNESRKQRIEIQVLRPLRDVLPGMFTVMKRHLEELQRVVEDYSAGQRSCNVARVQADKILEVMHDVLDHMMKAEDFNINVVQRLKKIIERQKELTKRTEKTEQDSLGEKE
jgi:hypothetical protein